MFTSVGKFARANRCFKSCSPQRGGLLFDDLLFRSVILKIESNTTTPNNPNNPYNTILNPRLVSPVTGTPVPTGVTLAMRPNGVTECVTDGAIRGVFIFRDMERIPQTVSNNPTASTALSNFVFIGLSR